MPLSIFPKLLTIFQKVSHAGGILRFMGLVAGPFETELQDFPKVGVSNDAVTFINSAIGAKAARFKTIIAVAAIGVFAGAALSNGMMEKAFDAK